MRNRSYLVTLTLEDLGRLEPDLLLTRLHTAIAAAIDDEYGDLSFYNGHARILEVRVSAVQTD